MSIAAPRLMPVSITVLTIILTQISSIITRQVSILDGIEVDAYERVQDVRRPCNINDITLLRRIALSIINELMFLQAAITVLLNTMRTMALSSCSIFYRGNYEILHNHTCTRDGCLPNLTTIAFGMISRFIALTSLFHRVSLASNQY